MLHQIVSITATSSASFVDNSHLSKCYISAWSFCTATCCTFDIWMISSNQKYRIEPITNSATINFDSILRSGWYVKPCISAHILVFKTVLFATSDTTQRRKLGVWQAFNLPFFKIKAWFLVSDQPVNECSSPPRFPCVANAQRQRNFLSSFLHRGLYHINSS